MPDTAILENTPAALHTVWPDRIVADAWRRWTPESNGQLPPDDGDWLVPMDFWLQHAAVLRGRSRAVGVLIAPQDSIERLRGEFQGLALIAVDFPSFKQGQGFSHGRLLRTRLGWAGEMRAVGNVLIDIVHYLARCGFDSFTITPDHDPATAQRQFQAFNLHYQQHYRNPATEMAVP